LRRDLDLRGQVRRERRQPLETHRERHAADRRVEHHVANLAPVVRVGRGAPDPRRERVEAAAAEPEIAVERRRGQRGEERSRRRHRAAAAMAQDASVPERANAVVFLAHEAALRIDLTGIDRRQLRCDRSRPIDGIVGRRLALWQRGNGAGKDERCGGDEQPAPLDGRRRIRHDGLPARRRQRRASIVASARGVVESHRRGHLSPIGRTRTIGARRGRRLPFL